MDYVSSDDIKKMINAMLESANPCPIGEELAISYGKLRGGLLVLQSLFYDEEEE